MRKEQNKAITATAISAMPIQPGMVGRRLALNRSISPSFATITVIIAMGLAAGYRLARGIYRRLPDAVQAERRGRMPFIAHRLAAKVLDLEIGGKWAVRQGDECDGAS